MNPGRLSRKWCVTGVGLGAVPRVGWLAWGTAGWLELVVRAARAARAALVVRAARAARAGHNFTHFRLVATIGEISTVAGPK
jgi:hypothetical protein